MKSLHLIAALTIALGISTYSGYTTGDGALATVQRQAKKKVKVCDGPAAYAYHKKVCTGLANCDYRILDVTLATALEMGRKPCEVCYK